jgi:hypothetical protein
MQRAPSCLLRAANRARNVAVREIAAVAQQDRGALSRRKRRNRVPHLAVALVDCDAGTRLIGWQRSVAAAACVINRFAVGDRQQPGTDVGVRTQARVGAKRCQEGLLKAVLGRLLADHPS